MLAPTDEPIVTEDTRFWLWSEVRSTSYRWRAGGKLDIDHHPGLRIRYEVNEQRYREAQAEAYGHEATDVTLPLDDYWWGDSAVPSPSYLDYQVIVVRGGRIDW